MSSLAVMVIVLLGIGLMIGIVKPDQIIRWLGILFVGLYLLSLIMCWAQNTYVQLSPTEKYLMMLLGFVILVIVFFELVFGSGRGIRILGKFFLQVVTFLITAPFKLLGNTIEFCRDKLAKRQAARRSQIARRTN